MIHDEYKTSMTCKWAAIREKELFFRRKICRLDNIKKDIELNNKYFKTPVVINGVFAGRFLGWFGLAGAGLL